MVAGQCPRLPPELRILVVTTGAPQLPDHFADSLHHNSRQALKKYVQANNKVTFVDTQFNKALKTGVEKGDFTQPKGKRP